MVEFVTDADMLGTTLAGQGSAKHSDQFVVVLGALGFGFGGFGMFFFFGGAFEVEGEEARGPGAKPRTTLINTNAGRGGSKAQVGRMSAGSNKRGGNEGNGLTRGLGGLRGWEKQE